MQNNTYPTVDSEPVTACIYDEEQAGVWLAFTKNQPEFIANVDKSAYQKILDYMATCSSMRHHMDLYFDALNANSNNRNYLNN